VDGFAEQDVRGLHPGLGEGGVAVDGLGKFGGGKLGADARVQQARGESEYIKQTGTAQADVIRAQGTAQADVIRAQELAKAEGFRAQNEAIGATSTTLVNIATVLAEKGAQFMPQILAVGAGSSIDGLAATLTKVLAGQANLPSQPSVPAGPEKT
jgi:glycerol dehydrogenase-like iron-containing ADH family enzyme